MEDGEEAVHWCAGVPGGSGRAAPRSRRRETGKVGERERGLRLRELGNGISNWSDAASRWTGLFRGFAKTKNADTVERARFVLGLC